MAESERDDIRDWLQKMLNSGQFSDFDVVCGDQTWKVHRAIVCARSTYFMKVCSGNFQEAHTSTIGFKDEDPKLIEDMLHWLYTNEYPNPSTEKHDAVDFVDAAKLYALADRHDLSGLKQDIIAFVEKFLDLEALDNIEDSFGYVIKLLKIVYTTTPRTDRGIRDVLIRLVWYGREWLLNSEGAQKDVLEIDGFAKDFLNVSIKSCRPKRVSPKVCARCKRHS